MYPILLVSSVAIILAASGQFPYKKTGNDVVVTERVSAPFPDMYHLKVSEPKSIRRGDIKTDF